MAPCTRPLGSLLVCLAAAIGCGGASSPVPAGTGARDPAAKRDFAITVTPASQNVAPGASVSYAVAATSTSGVQQIALSVTDLPVDVTGSFMPTTISSGETSTLTLTASSTAAAETVTFTVTGKAVGTTQTATATVVVGDVTPPSVSVAAPSAGARLSGTVSIAVNATDDVGVTRVEIYLDGALFATAASAQWDTTSSADGTHSITAKAYDAAGNAGTSSAVAVTVQNDSSTRDFAVAMSPPSSTLADGTSTSFTVTTSTVVGAAQPLSFAVQGLPAGVSATISPPTLTSGQSARVTVAASSSAPAATATFSVSATGVYATRAAQASLTVADTVPPQVMLQTPASPLSGTVLVHATAQDNTAVVSGAVYLDGAPVSSSLDYAWDTTSAADGAHTLEARAADAAGNTGTSGIVAVQVANGVATRDFDVTISPASQSVQGGHSVSYTVAVRTLTGSPQPVDLAVSNLPAGVTATFAATRIPSGSTTTLTLAAPAAAISSSSSFTVSGTGVYATRSASAELNVIDAQAPAVSFSAPAPNTQLSGSVHVEAVAADNAAVVGVEIYLDGALAVSAATFDWDTTASPDGPHVLEARAYDAAGNMGSTGPLQVVVQNNASTRSFSASMAPADATFAQGRSATFTVTTGTAIGSPQQLSIVARFADGGAGGLGATVSPANVVSGGASSTVTVTGSLPGAATLLVDVCGLYECQELSASVTVLDVTPPVVDLYYPVDGAVLSGSALAYATASDDSWPIDLKLYVDGVATGISPWNLTSWDTTAYGDGVHEVAAVAVDPAGNVGSVTHTVTIQNSPATHDFFIYGSPSDGMSVTIAAGSPVQGWLGSGESIGAPEALHLAASAPEGITVVFDPADIRAGDGSAVTIVASPDGAGGPVTLSATGTYLTKSTTFTLLYPDAQPHATLFPATGAVVSGTVSIGANVQDRSGMQRLSWYTVLLDGGWLAFVDDGNAAPSWDSTTVGDGPHVLEIDWGTSDGHYFTFQSSFAVQNSAATRDFALLPSSGTAVIGQSTPVSIGTATTIGSPQLLQFQDPLMPAGLSATFGVISITSGQAASLFVFAPLGTPPGDYQIPIFATGVYATHETTLQLSIRDLVPPQVNLSPLTGRTVVSVTNLMAVASDDVGVVRIEMDVDGHLAAAQDGPGALVYPWDTRTVADGMHRIDARAYDGAGNVCTASVALNVLNSPASHDLVLNGGFDDGRDGIGAWQLGGTKASAHQVWLPDGNPVLALGDGAGAGTSTASQWLWIPAGATSAQLSFRYRGTVPAGASPDTDWQEAAIYDSSGNLVATVFHQQISSDVWASANVDLGGRLQGVPAYELRFTSATSAGGASASVLYVDDVKLVVAPDGVGSASACAAQPAQSVLYLDGTGGDPVHPGVESISSDSFGVSPLQDDHGATSGIILTVARPDDPQQWTAQMTFLLDPIEAGKIVEGATDDFNFPSLYVASSSATCALSASRFQIHELQVDGQGVASFTATFEQSCLSYKPALRGCIHYAR